MITASSIARAIDPLHGSVLDRETIAEEVMAHIKAQLERDGLVITHGGHHLLDANDKTVWRAEPVAGVAAHVDPDSPSASAMIARRFARRT